MMAPSFPPIWQAATPLGQGGLAEVWLAQHASSGERWALKLLHPNLPDAVAAEAALLREHALLRNLAHPNLVAVGDVGRSEDGRAFYAMEALRPTPKPGEWTPDALRQGLHDALTALARLHAAQWVHGDLSPGNLMMGADGRLRLLDFGLLRPMGQAQNHISGTLSCLAPELARFEAADGRADLYSLACVAQWWWNGSPPFAPKAPLEQIQDHLHAVPAPLRPGLPDDLAAWMVRNLAKHPSQRDPSAQAALAGLGLKPSGPPPLLHPGLVGRDAPLAELEALLLAKSSLALRAESGVGASAFVAALAQALQAHGLRVLWVRPPASPGMPLAALAEALATLGLGFEALSAQKGDEAWLSPSRWQKLLAGAVWLVDAPDGLDESSRQALVGWKAWAPQLWVLAPDAPLPWLGMEEMPLLPLKPDALGQLAARSLALASLPGAWGDALRVASDGKAGAAWLALKAWVALGALPFQAGAWQPDAADLSSLRPVLAPKERWAEALPKWPAGALALGLHWALAQGPVGLQELAQVVGFTPAEGAEHGAFLAEQGALSPSGSLLPELAIALRWQAGPEAEARAHATWLRFLGPEASSARAWHALGAKAAVAEADAVLKEAATLLSLRALSELRRFLDALAPFKALAPHQAGQAWALEGELARRQGEAAKAIDAFKQALAMDPTGPSAARLASLSVACQMAGDAEGAWAAAEAAQKAGEEEGLPLEALRGAVRSARLAHQQGRPQAKALAESALAQARALKQVHKEAEALGLLALLLQGSEAEQAFTMAQEAVALQKSLGDAGDAGDLLSALDLAANLDLAAGRHAAALAGFQDVAVLAARMGGQGDEEALAVVNQAAVLFELARSNEALALVERGHAALEAKQSRFLATYAQALMGHLQVLVGRLAEGRQNMESAWHAAEAQKSGYLQKLVGMHRAEGLWWLGELGEVWRLAEHCLPFTEVGDEAHDRLLAMALSSSACLALWGPAAKHLNQVQARLATAGPESGRLRLALRVLGAKLKAEQQADWGWNATEALSLPSPGTEGPQLVGEAAWWQAKVLGAQGRQSEAAEAARQAHSSLARAGQAWPAAAAAWAWANWSEAPEAQAAAQSAQRDLAGMKAALSWAEVASLEALWWAKPLAEENALGELGHVSLNELLARARRAGQGEVGAERIAAFGRLVGSSLDVGVVLERAVEEAMALVGAERGMITMLDESGAMAGLVVRPREAISDDGLMNFSRTLVAASLEEDRAIALEDAQSDARFGEAASVMALDLRTVVCVPLRADGRAMGVLYLDRQSVGARFGADALALVEGISSFAGLALAKAREHAAARARLALLEAYQALRGLDDQNQALEGPLARAIAQAAQLLGSHQASFWVPDGIGSWALALHVGSSPIGDAGLAESALKQGGLLPFDDGLALALDAGLSTAGVLMVALPELGLPAEPAQMEALEALSKAMGRALAARAKAQRQSAREAHREAALEFLLARRGPGGRDAASGLSSRAAMQAWLQEDAAQNGLLVGLRLQQPIDREAWQALGQALDAMAHLGGRAARWGPLEALLWVPTAAMPPEAYLPAIKAHLPSHAQLGMAATMAEESPEQWAHRSFTQEGQT